ncbi:class I SAM-dependent methyltransferase [Leptothrix discophora]|uniref:Class I SAM-dependent methyltransferase n=1 Tax=Leptothrix discophora TaxID=89 RepID=A0ABT9G254_LEPDI|nr:class I SAM-dependent methyltransferase [Leptothrix discophora]MDP4300571.1 class I SAM-dependent methyltransferase [Leptothrix discophora]
MTTLTPATGHGAGLAPSDWLMRHSRDLAAARRVLDLACGGGRHARWLAAQGHAVTALDRDAEALASLQGIATECIEADIEAGPWPLAGRSFDLVVVTNYLWRPLFPAVVASVAPGGRLIWETFALGQEQHGRPSRPDFLLRPGELLTLAGPELRVGAYEDGLVVGSPEHPEAGATRRVQRIVLDRVGADGVPPVLRL